MYSFPYLEPVCCSMLKCFTLDGFYCYFQAVDLSSLVSNLLLLPARVFFFQMLKFSSRSLGLFYIILSPICHVHAFLYPFKHTDFIHNRYFKNLSTNFTISSISQSAFVDEFSSSYCSSFPVPLHA